MSATHDIGIELNVSVCLSVRCWYCMKIASILFILFICTVSLYVLLSCCRSGCSGKVGHR